MTSAAERFRRPLTLLALVFAGLVLPGCASPWKASFEPASPSGEIMTFPPTEQAVLRNVPWERLNAALTAIESARAASDIHPDEWPQERLAAEHANLVTALQLSEPPQDIAILGRSVFRSTRDPGPLDGDLSAFARSIGADYAIWTTTYLGTRETVTREPVTRTGFDRRYHRHDGRLDYDYLPYHETLYVPVVVERDQYAWLVYYARVLRSSEP